MPPTSTSTWFPRDGMSRVWKTRRPGSGITTDTWTERMDTDLGATVREGARLRHTERGTMSLRRERILILALLLILAAASWVILVWQSRTASGMGMGLTMGMGAAVFLAIWVVMMIAMMFPTAAPMILVFARVQRDRHSSERLLRASPTGSLDYDERGPD